MSETTIFCAVPGCGQKSGGIMTYCIASTSYMSSTDKRKREPLCDNHGVMYQRQCHETEACVFKKGAIA